MVTCAQKLLKVEFEEVAVLCMLSRPESPSYDYLGKFISDRDHLSSRRGPTVD